MLHVDLCHLSERLSLSPSCPNHKQNGQTNKCPEAQLMAFILARIVQLTTPK